MLQRWESFLRAIVGRSRDFMFLTTSWNDKIEFNGRHTRLRCIILSSKHVKMRHIGWQEPLSDIRKIPLLANSTFLLQPRRLVAPGVRRKDWDGTFTNTSPNILDCSNQCCNYASCGWLLIYIEGLLLDKFICWVASFNSFLEIYAATKNQHWHWHWRWHRPTLSLDVSFSSN